MHRDPFPGGPGGPPSHRGPIWAACSPLCARVMPAGLIDTHRDTCARFDRYIAGALMGRWGTR